MLLNETDPTYAIRKLIIDTLKDVHTCMPGRIENVNVDDTLDVLPMIKNPYTQEEFPIVCNVPYLFGGDSYLKIEVETGDIVLMLFAERSIENYDPEGRVAETPLTRQFDLSDCIVIPLLFTVNIPITGLHALIDERIIAIYNAHTHAGPGVPPTVLITDLTPCKTTKVKAC